MYMFGTDFKKWFHVKISSFVVTKLDHDFIPFSAFYFIFEFLLFYLLNLIFLKSVFFTKNYFFELMMDFNNKYKCESNRKLVVFFVD